MLQTVSFPKSVGQPIYAIKFTWTFPTRARLIFCTYIKHYMSQTVSIINNVAVSLEITNI